MKIIDRERKLVEFTLEDRSGSREIAIFMPLVAGFHKSGYGTVIHLTSGQSFGVRDDYEDVKKIFLGLGK